MSNGKTMATNTTPGNQPKTSETHDGSSNRYHKRKIDASNKRYQARVRKQLQQSKIKEILADETRGQFANHYYPVRWKDGHHDSSGSRGLSRRRRSPHAIHRTRTKPKDTQKHQADRYKLRAKHNGRYGLSAAEGSAHLQENL